MNEHRLEETIKSMRNRNRRLDGRETTGARQRRTDYTIYLTKALASVRSPSGCRGQSRPSSSRSRRWIYTSERVTRSAADPPQDPGVACVSSARLTAASAHCTRSANKRRFADAGTVRRCDDHRRSVRGTEGGLQHPVRAVEQRTSERVPQRADLADPPSWRSRSSSWRVPNWSHDVVGFARF